MYTPCVLNNNMCVYADYSNHSYYYNVQVIIKLKYMIVIKIDYSLFLVAFIYHHIPIRFTDTYAYSLNKLNLLLYVSVVSPYICTILVICTCMM